MVRIEQDATGAAASMEAHSCSLRGAVQTRGGGMRKYEVMFILPAEADDAAVKGAIERISRVIGESGGEVTRTDPLGRRRLAYEIDKHGEGYYVVADFT